MSSLRFEEDTSVRAAGNAEKLSFTSNDPRHYSTIYKIVDIDRGDIEEKNDDD